MDYANELLEFLSQNTDFCEIILAPGSVPVQRLENAVEPIGTRVLTASDINDTLIAFAAHSRNGGKDNLPKEGAFSFGFPARGRFRVAFMTQRGSHVLSIVKVPLDVPQLSGLLGDAALAQKAEATFCSYTRGLLGVTGPSTLLTNTFVYSLIHAVNDSQPRLILVLERAASFLLKHGKSVILQCEIGTDVSDLEQGLRNAMSIGPDILYIRDICNREELNMAQKFAENKTLTVVTLTVLDVEKWFFRGQFSRESLAPQASGMQQSTTTNLGLWQVFPAPARGQVTLRMA